MQAGQAVNISSGFLNCGTLPSNARPNVNAAGQVIAYPLHSTNPLSTYVLVTVDTSGKVYIWGTGGSTQADKLYANFSFWLN